MKTPWRCDQCDSAQKPTPTPGLMDQFLNSVAEFCSDFCRETFLKQKKPESLQKETT